MRVPLVSRGSWRREEGGPFAADEEQLERAVELERIDLHRYADRVRACGAKEGVLEVRRCGLRSCPRCAARIASENASIIEAAIRTMRRPVVGVFTLISKRVGDLSDALERLVRSMQQLRRHSLKLGIRRFVGAIHPKVTENGERWNVHLHVALEVGRGRLGEIAAFWTRLVRGRGTFEYERHRLRVHDPCGYARYIAGENDWSPALDRGLGRRHLGVLIAGLRHRRLIVRWGFRRRPSWTWVVVRASA